MLPQREKKKSKNTAYVIVTPLLNID